MPKSKGKILEQIMKRVPYADQIRDIDTDSDPEAVRFTWRGDRFSVNLRFSVVEVSGRFVIGSNKAILLERLLQWGSE